MKIFWSWQSDTPGKTGRFLVRDALKDAINRLRQAEDIEEPVRAALHVDQDIQDVTGSPDLVATILGKIDASEVVVADVTMVGRVVAPTDGDKKLINSNVAIELGYALHSISDRNVLLAFNRHYGSHEDLPFDLRHKGGAIVFDVPPDASRERIDADRFVIALKPYTQKPPALSVALSGTPSTFSKAAYFMKGEVLATQGEPGPNHFTCSYDRESLCYVRFIPARPLRDLMCLPILKDAVSLAPLLTREDKTHIGLNSYGAIRFKPRSYLADGRATIDASTQLFESGEIWSIGAGLVRTKAHNRLIDASPFILSAELEHVCYDTLELMLEFAAKHLALRLPWQVELGLVRTKGLNLQVVEHGLPFERPILKDEIIHKATLTNDQASFDQLLLGFFSKVHDATGTARPDSYFGFPPNRPGSAP